jgi:hypothetical protein
MIEKRRLKRKTTKDHYSKPELPSNHQIKRKKSLGALRPNQKTKPRSPVATGKLHFQRHTLEEIYSQLDETGGDEVVCNIAGWKNEDQQGKYLTVEVSPEFVLYGRRTSRPGMFDDMFNDGDE